MASRFMGRRPLALVSICYAIGALAGYYAYVPPITYGILAVICALGLLFGRRMICLMMALMFAGGCIVSARMVAPLYIPADDILITGRVVQQPQSDDLSTMMMLDSVMLDGEDHPHRLRAYAYDAADWKDTLRVGDEVSFVGNTWLPKSQRNPGGFDFARWLWTRDVALCASVDAVDVSVRSGEGFSIPILVGHVREGIGRVIDQRFPEQNHLVRALILGERDALPDQVRDDFSAAGLAHLLAISGLHVGCLALLLEQLLRLIRLPHKASLLVTLVLLTAYAALIGFPATVVRALLMFMCMRSAPLAGRPNDSLTGLCLAMLAILMGQPAMIGDTGFQLSFGAIFGILLLRQPLAKLLHMPLSFRWPGIEQPREAAYWCVAGISDALITSLSIQLITLPITVNTFGTLAMLSPLINLVAIPLTTLALPLVLLKLALGAGWFLLPDLLLGQLQNIASWAARVPFGTLNLPGWPFYLVILYGIMCFLASPYVRIRIQWRKWLLCALPALVLVSVLLARIALPGGLHITLLDADQADATVIRAEGHTFAVDVGKRNGPLDDYLVYSGQRLEAVFLTHPHEDHVGGFAELIDRMDVGMVYLPECWNRVQAEGDINEALSRARSRGTRIEYLKAGDRVQLSEQVTVDVLQPENGASPSDGNAASMVLHVQCGEASALLMGDLPSKAELPLYPDVDLLKAAHHGSGSSNSETLLHMTSPSAVAISVGNNGFGHPSDRLLDRAKALGAAIYRTDQNGAIFVQMQPDGQMHVTTFLSAEGD